MPVLCKMSKQMVSIFTPGQYIAFFISFPFEILSIILSTIQLIFIRIKVGKADSKTSNWSPLPSVSLLIKNVRRTHILMIGFDVVCISFFFVLSTFEIAETSYFLLNFDLPVILVCTIYSIYIALQAKKAMGSKKEYDLNEDENEKDENNPYDAAIACQRCVLICNSIMFIPFVLLIVYSIKVFVSFH